MYIQYDYAYCYTLISVKIKQMSDFNPIENWWSWVVCQNIIVTEGYVAKIIINLNKFAGLGNLSRFLEKYIYFNFKKKKKTVKKTI